MSRRFTREVVPLFESGALRPVIDRRFPLDECADAHEHIGGRRQRRQDPDRRARLRAPAPSAQGVASERALPHRDGLAAEHDTVALEAHAHDAARGEACSPTSRCGRGARPRTGASTQWAEPVTGSSSMPTAGRRSGSRSRCPRSPGAVTMTPRASRAARAEVGLQAPDVGVEPELDEQVEAARGHGVDLGRAEGASKAVVGATARRAGPGSRSRSSRRAPWGR